MATALDEKLLATEICQVTSLEELEGFYARIEGSSLLEAVYKTKKGQLEAQKGMLEAQKGMLEAQKGLLESVALLEGTYFEDVNGLWDFTFEIIVSSNSHKDKVVRNNLFQKIARENRPSCYIGTGLFVEPSSSASLPQAMTVAMGTNSSVGLRSTDIFGNPFNKKRAHNAPDSITCSPSWGHAVEGATGTIGRQRRDTGKNKARKNKIRRLLIMGAEGQGKNSSFRYSPFNFIILSAHDDYDKAPHIMFLPIMDLDEIRRWNNTAYDVLVIASSFDGRDAKDVYRSIARDKSIGCSPEEIEKATSSLVDFMKGLAASLLNEVPIELADLAGNESKKTELRAVQGQIRRDGISLPRFQKGKSIRPVLKLRFDRSAADDPIADPWMLMAKAAVNLSWCRGQKLLPVCKPREAENWNEGDIFFWQNMADYKAKQRAASIPTTLSVPMTPDNGGPGADRNVTPEKEEDDWEYMDLFYKSGSI